MQSEAVTYHPNRPANSKIGDNQRSSTIIHIVDHHFRSIWNAVCTRVASCVPFLKTCTVHQPRIELQNLTFGRQTLAMSIRTHLRNATKESHQRLDRQFAQLEMFSSMQGYRDYLACMQAMQIHFGASVHGSLRNLICPSERERLKAACARTLLQILKLSSIRKLLVVLRLQMNRHRRTGELPMSWKARRWGEATLWRQPVNAYPAVQLRIFCGNSLKTRNCAGHDFYVYWSQPRLNGIRLLKRRWRFLIS